MPFDVENFRFKTKPYEHQKEALIQGADRDVFAYFMEMGTGKSKVIADTIAYLYDEGKINAAFVVGNKGSYRSWVSSHIPDHLPDHVRYYLTYWDSGASKELRATYDELFEVTNDLKIFVMNVEALSLTKGRAIELARNFLLTHEGIMVMDESTAIKNKGANRTKNVIKLGKNVTYKRILTGEPVTKSPMDLWSQSEFLSPSLLGHTSFFAFQSHYADLELKEGRGAGGKKYRYTAVKGYKHLDELQNIVKSFSYRVKKEDCLDLPPKVYETYDVELTDEQVDIYKALLRKSIAELSEGTQVVTTPLIITKLLRLHQVTCGFVTSDDGEIHELKNNRLDSLLELLDEMDGKIIIWATYRHDLASIISRLASEFGPDSTVGYYGATSADDRALAVERFQNDSSCRFFVGNPSVGGFGITLTAASAVVYYSNSYNLEHRLQSEDRAHRIGQTKTVTYVDLVVRKTVDEKILQALKEKRNLAAEVLGDLITFEEWLK